MLFSQLQYEKGEKLQRHCLNHIREHRRTPFSVSGFKIKVAFEFFNFNFLLRIPKEK
jgi:hypothetical protein